jgi:hypothetical protein
LPTAEQHFERRTDCVGRNGRIVRGLAEDDQVNPLRFDRGIFQIAQPKLQVLQAVLLRLGRAERDDSFRVEYPGVIYLLINRGDRLESIFKDEEDRQRFLDTLGEACVKTGWQVHA